MGIGNPIFFFLSAFIIAVILMYFFRKRYQDQLVSSSLLWEEVMKEWQASPWFHRLQKNLLLFMQVLILLLLMLALVKPYTLGEMGETDHTIILLDTSASMNATMNEQSHFELAKKDIQSLISDADGDITLLAVGSSVSTILSEEMNDQVVIKQLQDIPLSNDHEDMQKAFHLAQALGKGSESIIHIYSDSVRKANFTEEKITTPVQVHNLLKNSKNVSLTSFGVEKVGSLYQGVAVIENQSKDMQSGKITIYAANKIVSSKRLEIGAGKEEVIPLPELPESPVYKAEITFQDDFKVDNVLSSIQATSKPAISVIGELNPFLLKGFQSLGVEVKTISGNQLKKGDGILVTTNDKWKELSVKNPAMIIPGSSVQLAGLTSGIDVKEGDPLLKHVDLEKVYVEKAGSIEMEGLETLAMSDSIPLIQKGEREGIKNVLVNMRLNDTDFPLHPGFPIFLHNVYQYLSEDQGFIGYFQPGEERTVPGGKWDIYSSGDEYIKESGDGDVFKAPLNPGVYQAVQGDVMKYFSVVLDDREKQLGGESFTLESSERKREKEEKTVPQVLSSWFLLLAIIVFFIEWEVYRRGNRI
ncbi:BatA and WFA domain-containing protein [Rossellomorea sp. NPDC077527]|uniref:BatA and WFA domain-containing protein n=1 Tax=Rossellomorea sp. NPDC077527 TaxID=3364510 RepID=UPI0037CA2C75